VEPGDVEGYVVTVPAVPGCFPPQDAIVQEAVEHAHEVIEVRVTGLLKGGESVPDGDALPSEIDMPVTVTVAA
jgi:predicted RNase H-like HicB family nuclease